MTKGERIRELRMAKNWSQTEFAEKIGQSKQTVYKYETNKVTNIPSDVIEKIASVLGTTPSYLFGWEDSEQNKPSEPPARDPLDEKILQLFSQLTPEERREVLGLIFEKLHSRGAI